MPNWADELIQEYSNGKRQLHKLHNSLDKENPTDRQDRKVINSMIDDMEFTIEWLETGKQPGTYRGVDKRLAYQRKALESMDIIPDITEQLDINNRQLYMTSEEKIILADIFTSFSLRERQCYVLHAAQGMSMGQIADDLGLSKATVQMYITRARRKVETKVEKKVS
ncbi:sigma factor-like helix-turn-helix DNA-binding protein [Lederbergia wuyishanensis]|uniref:RNA polymerase sigma-70 factor (ECF subfamily) n=1 Tax=Lederbergia wuyishanensis TaxID=1347903 RepID=A0ABU0D753_9BACI|nr:sigma factor-like helix-turn-helix DNA-binding protein [Lederbergia wuyishanensis]MCJ8008915.1 LuxR C-terminal-related transcriptional regulator [Lederbergia wuyishanensis]MDQ0344241.1 RNA polymerase sigma-70 factor (ECF subfamily) [Lederbergia wuyishanensis]